MTLANGRPMLAIPGPSVIPDRVLQKMHQPAPNIYGGMMEDLTNDILIGLKDVARTQHNVALYICNGHGVWEAALANLVAPNDKVLALSSGRFGQGWAIIAKALGADLAMLDWGPHKGLNIAELHQALAADKDKKIKLLTCTHVDTSSSIKYDIASVRKVLDDLGHPALLMVDCIASLACDPFEMDAWGVDVMVTACQKGLMTPPGLGMVFFNDKAVEKRQALDIVSPYWDWTLRAEPEVFYHRFYGTSPTHHLFGLHEALKMILAEEGLENVWARHQTLAETVWSAFDVWSEKGHVTMNVTNLYERSAAVTAAKIDNNMATPIRLWLAENFGLTVGIGLAMAEPGDPKGDSFFRIGHMGHLNAHMLLGTLSALNSALLKFNVPIGEGAIEAANRVIVSKMK